MNQAKEKVESAYNYLKGQRTHIKTLHIPLTWLRDALQEMEKNEPPTQEITLVPYNEESALTNGDFNRIGIEVNGKTITKTAGSNFKEDLEKIFQHLGMNVKVNWKEK